MTDPETPFSALVLDRRDGELVAEQRLLTQADLPPGEVLVRVSASSINYKDALAVTGRGRIVSGYPIVPGIDLAGTVVASTNTDARPGEAVVVCGRGIGETHWGGYAVYARVQAEWLIRLPAAMDLHRAMVAGTAGYTAMLAVMTLEEQGLRPGAGDVVVTGASGGVGSFAVALLSRLGHRVVAVTGRAETRDYLARLGATEVLDRGELAAAPGRPMLSARWVGAVDSVGGTTLANLLASMDRHASVAACGLAGGTDLATTVFPFILRGVNLMGIDSNYASRRRRQLAFERLAEELPAEAFTQIEAGTVSLEAVPERCAALLDGLVRGRLVVALP